MKKFPNFRLIAIENLQYIKGIPFPASLKYRQLLVTGPPGCGKTRLINRIGGWPEEGYIDLTLKYWWRAQSLTFRPREVQLGLPFVGQNKALTVFDKPWLESPQPLELDFERMYLPPTKPHFLSPNWRNRYVFEFLLPSAQNIFEWRIDRSRRQSHPIDTGVNLEQVRRQIAVFYKVALYFHKSGILVYIRNAMEGVPKRIQMPAHENR